MNGWFFLIPIISAAGGWLFQSLALAMLFRPKQPFNILGYMLQGVVPKRKNSFAEKVGAAAVDFVSFDEIEKKIIDPANLKRILPAIEQHIDHFLRVKLKVSMPMIGMLIGDRTINQLKQVFMDELEALFPIIMQQYAGSLKEDVNIQEIISQKIKNVSDDTIESLIYQNIGSDLRKLKLYGAFFGFIIGLLQLGIVYMALK